MMTAERIAATPPDYFARATDAELHLWARRAWTVLAQLDPVNTVAVAEVHTFMECCYVELGERYVRSLARLVR